MDVGIPLSFATRGLRGLALLEAGANIDSNRFFELTGLHNTGTITKSIQRLQNVKNRIKFI
jgi:hypothetical protein